MLHFNTLVFCPIRFNWSPSVNLLLASKENGCSIRTDKQSCFNLWTVNRFQILFPLDCIESGVTDLFFLFTSLSDVTPRPLYFQSFQYSASGLFKGDIQNSIYKHLSDEICMSGFFSFFFFNNSIFKRMGGKIISWRICTF